MHVAELAGSIPARAGKEGGKMKIVAIWDRQKAAPESKTSFCLLEDGRFLTVAPEEEYQGTDKKDNRIYKDTGKPEYYSVFNDKDRFDFKKAHFFISRFGANLLYHKGETIDNKRSL